MAGFVFNSNNVLKGRRSYVTPTSGGTIIVRSSNGRSGIKHEIDYYYKNTFNGVGKTVSPISHRNNNNKKEASVVQVLRVATTFFLRVAKHIPTSTPNVILDTWYNKCLLPGSLNRVMERTRSTPSETNVKDNICTAIVCLTRSGPLLWSHHFLRPAFRLTYLLSSLASYPIFVLKNSVLFCLDID